MSSTNRGKRGGGGADYYPTPAWATRAILDRLGARLTGSTWLEPSAGRGHLIRAVNDWMAEQGREPRDWSAVELRPECLGDLLEAGADPCISDFLDTAKRWRAAQEEGETTFDVAILNPPFSLALEFAEACQGLAADVLVLERLTWLESDERRPFFTGNMPDVYLLGRVDFTGAGGDSIPYAWFHWRAGESRTHGRIELLDRPAPKLRTPGPRDEATLPLFGGGQ
jgi:hypothetical protein